ncbi:galactosylceramide sulfotransferase-like isoform X2 [Dermacentor albipictus]|uniref:galactosylceramide sulfotransferase-like isoform X2 n=1 Tax=Dermacentor albipictus TaxID=60249 RepID=UPI0031FD6919
MKLALRLQLGVLLVGAAVTYMATWSIRMNRAKRAESGNNSSPLQPSSCHPARSVVFLKMHKAGSSTVFNILLRYAAEEGLILALPNSAAQFQHSTSKLFDPQKRHFGDEPLEEFLFNDDHVRALQETRFAGNLGFNQMAFDLGMHPADFDDHDKVDELISTVESTFDVVMVAERFTESLVLLRKKLCLPSLRSVVAFRKNALQNRTTLTPRVVARLAQLNAADTRIYEHFARRLQSQLHALGAQSVASEVARIEATTRRWLARCVESTTTGRRVVAHRLREGMDYDATCHRLALSEIEFTKELRWAQTRLARQRTGFFYH